MAEPLCRHQRRLSQFNRKVVGCFRRRSTVLGADPRAISTGRRFISEPGDLYYMQLYHIHFFDRRNVRFLVRDWSGADDLAALAEAQSLSTTHTIEVWQGERRVAHVKPANKTLRSATTQSL